MTGLTTFRFKGREAGDVRWSLKYPKNAEYRSHVGVGLVNPLTCQHSGYAVSIDGVFITYRCSFCGEALRDNEEKIQCLLITSETPFETSQWWDEGRDGLF